MAAGRLAGRLVGVRAGCEAAGFVAAGGVARVGRVVVGCVAGSAMTVAATVTNTAQAVTPIHHAAFRTIACPRKTQYTTKAARKNSP